MTIESRRRAIKRAVKCAGGEKAVAAEFGLTFQAVQHWIYKARVPAPHILKLSNLGGVKPSEIDSDIYPESVPFNRAVRTTTARAA